MKFELIREVYDRCPATETKKSTFKAKSNVDALRKVLEHCMYGFDYEDEESMKMSEEELKESIYSMNGDGCDYIMSLINTETKEVLVEGDYYSVGGEENW